MSLSSRIEGARLVSFRLSDLDLNLRLAAAQRFADDVARDGGVLSVLEAAQVRRAAQEPSDRVYWISEEKFREATRPRVRRRRVSA